jgi:hypothetical protein
MATYLKLGMVLFSPAGAAQWHGGRNHLFHAT